MQLGRNRFRTEEHRVLVLTQGKGGPQLHALLSLVEKVCFKSLYALRWNIVSVIRSKVFRRSGATHVTGNRLSLRLGVAGHRNVPEEEELHDRSVELRARHVRLAQVDGLLAATEAADVEAKVSSAGEVIVFGN